MPLNCDLLISRTKSALVEDLSQDEICCGKDVTIHSTAELRGPTVIGNGCKIDRRVQVKGPVVIRCDCYVAEGASIEEAVLWNGVRVGTCVSLKQCIIGSDTEIGSNDQLFGRMVTPEHIASVQPRT